MKDATPAAPLGETLLSFAAPDQDYARCRERSRGVAMSRLSHLQIVRPETDQTIAVAQSIHDNQKSRMEDGDKNLRNWKLSFSAAVLFSVVVLASLALNQSPREATAIMERLAAKVEMAQRIPPETRDTILKLLSTRRYDCEEVKCDPGLQARNRLARERISKAILAASFAADPAEQNASDTH
jgi:hypothetical protein